MEATEGAGDPGGLRPPEQVCDAGRHDEEHLLMRFREIIRRRHYARSTEESYLAWVRRFFEYRRHTGEAGQPSAADVKAFLTRWDSEYDYLSLISPGRCPSCQTMVAPGRAMPVLAAHPTVPRAPCASTITCPGGGQCSSMGPGTSAEGPLPSADITKAGNCSRAQNLRASYVRDRRMPELKPYAKTGIRHRFRFSRDGYYDTPVS